MDRFLCGCVVEKQGTVEKFCTNEGVYAIPLTDDDDTKVVDGIVLCQLHSDRFDAGFSLMVKTRKGQMCMIHIEPEAGIMGGIVDTQKENQSS